MFGRVLSRLKNIISLLNHTHIFIKSCDFRRISLQLLQVFRHLNFIYGLYYLLKSARIAKSLAARLVYVSAEQKIASKIIDSSATFSLQLQYNVWTIWRLLRISANIKPKAASCFARTRMSDSDVATRISLEKRLVICADKRLLF